MNKKVKTKTELMKSIRHNRKLLDKKIEKLTTEQIVWPGSMNDWSVKDILGHLIDWEQRFIGWYETGLRGEEPEIPAAGFTWAELSQLNQSGYELRKDNPLEETQKEYIASYAQIITLIEGIEEKQIFKRGLYAWTGKDALLVWIDANTASHYNWARRNIRSSVIAKAFREERE